MKVLIDKSKYLILVAVATLLITFALALFWGVVSALSAWVEIITSAGKAPAITLDLIKVVDAFLLIIVLYLLAASIYKLFVGDLDLPSRLVARTLPELKSKLSGIVVLVIAVRFVEYLFEDNLPAVEVFWLAAATALVAGTLIAFDYFGRHNGGDDEEQSPPG